MNISKKKYYLKSQMNNSFIMIKHGENGYYETDIKTNEEANALNLIEGNTEAHIKSASSCSIFECWDEFDNMVHSFEIRENVCKS